MVLSISCRNDLKTSMILFLHPTHIAQTYQSIIVHIQDIISTSYIHCTDLSEYHCSHPWYYFYILHTLYRLIRVSLFTSRILFLHPTYIVQTYQSIIVHIQDINSASYIHCTDLKVDYLIICIICDTDSVNKLTLQMYTLHKYKWFII